jgi:UDP-N-acetylmuramyl pentapeptide phosphotransferase/UDP-N-acetylglucosamine-1-phosphate transferase
MTILSEIATSISLTFVIAAIAGSLGTWFCIKLFPWLGLLDCPERYNLVRKKIPYPGGIFFVLSSISLIIIDKEFSFLLPLVGCLGLLSLADDLHPLSSKLRFTLHLLIIVAVILFGIQIRIIGNPFAGTNIFLPTSLAWIFTISWIMGLQQSMNWFDGLKGLSVGIAGIGFLFMGILSLVRPELLFDPSHTSLLLATWTLAGFCIGAWWFYWQGKILLGDTGSQVLGFLLGVISIFSGAKIGTMLMVLALPLLDFVIVIGRRIFVEKKSPFQGDQKHLHHLLRNRYGEKKAVALLIITSVLFGISSVFISQMHKLIGVGLVAIIVIIGYVHVTHKK